jgi:tRNA(fMet)-specific endonuclease VapC
MLETFPPIPFDLRCARAHARIRAELAARGADVGPHDRIVAATAIALGWRVGTANLRHFAGVPGLAVTQLDLSDG